MFVPAWSSLNRLQAKDHEKALAWLAIAIFFLLFYFLSNKTTFYWDALHYWRLSHRLGNFPNNRRGYFFPALLAPVAYLCDLSQLNKAPHRWPYLSAYWLVASMVYSYALTCMMPEFYSRLFGHELGFFRRLWLPVLLAIIFPGLILYPLSDLPALLLMLAAVVIAMRSADFPGKPKYLLLILSGVLAYGAYNTRTIFMFVLLPFVFLVPIAIHRREELRKKLLIFAAVLAGVGMAAAPQMKINYHNLGVASPTVPVRGLYAEQLRWGIYIQRYETNIMKDAPGPDIYYVDPEGVELLRENGRPNSVFDFHEYLRLLVSHPVTFSSIYFRHLVNGLDVRDGEEYIETPSPERNVRSAVNFAIVFAGLAIILTAMWKYPPTRKEYFNRYLWVLVFTLPVLAILPGAIETRFFLPVDLTIYSAIAFGFHWESLRRLSWRKVFLMAGVFSLAAMVFFSVTLATMSHMQYEKPDLSTWQASVHESGTE